MGVDNFPNLSAQEAVIAHRRELVARARLRGATIREIVVALTAIGFVNPVTEEPWSKSIVHQDIQALEGEWRQSAQQAIEEHKAQQLAELQEVRRQAWHDNDMASVLRAISLEMDLLGTPTPAKKEAGDEAEIADATDPRERIASRIAGISERKRTGDDSTGLDAAGSAGA
jgi:hypothetical protein